MRLLFDENLSRRLVDLLVSEYPGSVHVGGAGLAGMTDQELWKYAATQNLLIVTKDADFRHLALLHGPPPKVIWLQIGNGPTAAAETVLRDRFPDVRSFFTDPVEALLILP